MGTATADRLGVTARLAALPLWVKMTAGVLSVAVSAFVGLSDL